MAKMTKENFAFFDVDSSKINSVFHQRFRELVVTQLVSGCHAAIFPHVAEKVGEASQKCIVRHKR